MISERLLDAVYAVSTSEDAFAPLLARLADAFGCISAALVYVDPARPAADVALGHGVFDEEAKRRYEADYAAIDPAPMALAALPIGTAASTNRLFDAQERASLRFVTEFYNPLGLYESLGAPIARADGQFGIMAVHRGCDRAPFSDREIEIFGQLATHVSRAIALRGRFFQLARAAETRRKMLDEIAAGVIAVDVSGRLVEANRAAREILGRGDALLLTRAGRIRTVDRDANTALGAALAAETGAPAFVVAPSKTDHARPCVLKVGPVKDATYGTMLIQIADARTQAADVEQTSNVEEALVQALGLSRRSSRLTAALLRGEDLNGYAKRSGLSQNTVKFHLKSAFRITGTRRQSELVGLAVSVLRDLSI